MNPEDISKFMDGAPPTSVLVNDLSEIEELFQDIEQSMLTVEKLCDKIDPDTEPYKSKYEARNIIESLIKKMEGTRVVAVMEQKQNIILNLDWRLASIRVKMATIDWDCEEPHNTELELGTASKYYFPDLYNNIMTITTDDSDTSNLNDIESFIPQLPSVFGNPKVEFNTIVVDVLKCLNLLGILWAGRGNVKRSFMFLHSSYKLYDEQFRTKQNDQTTSINSSIESVYTHTCFYLAQCYGHLGNVIKSSQFCHETLQRQLHILTDPNSAIEWIKNCLGMSDYYLTTFSYIQVSALHLSCEKVFEKYILQQQNEKKASIDPDIYEIKGEIYIKSIQLDVKLLSLAFETEITKRNSDDDENIWTSSSASKTNKNNEENNIIEKKESTADIKLNNDRIYSHFEGIPVQIPEISHPSEIINFETARKVYLRALQKIQFAIEIYPLDGHVTNYVGLLLSHSRLYHYLALFETDLKRKFTMENRRVEMLRPLLQSLSYSAYEGLHKNVIK